MGKDTKRLCKWDKDDVKNDLKKLKKIVLPPTYICCKCGRVASDEDYLCKPEKV